MLSSPRNLRSAIALNGTELVVSSGRYSMLRGIPPAACLAVLVLACSAQPTITEPVADVEAPAFKKGGGNPGGGDNPGSSQYSYTFTGDVVTDPDPGTAGENVGKGDAESVVLDGGGSGSGQEIVGFAFLSDLDPDGDCFTQPFYDFSGALNRDNRYVNKVSATFYFGALATDGAGIKYVLSLDGTVDGDFGGTGTSTADADIFPPEPGESTKIDFTGGRMETEGKGKGQGGKACIGDVELHTATSVTLEGTAS
jgi:hypothetical protein